MISTPSAPAQSCARAMSRPTLDRALRLDVRAILRWFAKEPGGVPFIIVRWSNGSTIGMHLHHRTLILNYQAHGADIREELRLDLTPCNYGGSRAWVRCPTCGVRRAVLYAAGASGSRFLCRTCFGWPYGSQMEREAARALRRARMIRVRQGDDHPDPFAPLGKRHYQRWSTFGRVQAGHCAALSTYLDHVIAASGYRAAVMRERGGELERS